MYRSAVRYCTNLEMGLYIFTVTLGTVTVSINPDSQSAFYSLSVELFQDQPLNDINNAVLAFSSEETCWFPV